MIAAAPVNLTALRAEIAAAIALRVPDVAAAKSALEAKGVAFVGDVFDTSVCHMAIFHDPDGHQIMLHRRYAPQ